MNRLRIMNRYLREKFGQKFLSGKLVLLIMGVMFCICLDTWNQIPFLWKSERGTLTGYYYFFNSYVFGGQYLPFFALALSAVIGTVDYCKEIQSGVDRYVIQRLGSAKDYAISKVWFSILTGNFIYLMGMVVFLIFALFFQPFYDSSLNMETQGLPYHNCLATGDGWLYFVILLYLAMLRTTMWNMVALWVSAFVKNIYVTIAAPILASYILSRLLTLLRLESELRLDYWLSGRSIFVSENYTLIVCTIFALVISAICIINFVRKVKSDEQNR